VYGVTFVSGGRALALGCGDGTTVIWKIVPWAKGYADTLRRVCGFVWGSLTPIEWNTLAPDLPDRGGCARR
jgi:hypothetical protein